MADRRAFLLALTAGLFVVQSRAGAQSSDKVVRIGLLRQGVQFPPPAFWAAMRDRGWVEGRNVSIEARYAQLADQLQSLAAELVALKLDLVLTDGTPATRAMKQATDSVPIVFTLGADPVEGGLVGSLARPGGNLTGFTYGEYADKQLQVLIEALPRVSHVACPVETLNRALVRAATTHGIRLTNITVRQPEEIEKFFAAARSAGAQAVLINNVARFSVHMTRFARASMDARVPAIGYYREFADSGGLLAYGPRPQHWPRLAYFVDRILNGSRPADLAVEQPTLFDLVINRGTASRLGIEIPRSLALRAEFVP